MKTKENYYLVQYNTQYCDKNWGIKNEGVFTKKGWEKWIKEENEMRDQEDHWEENMQKCEKLGQFIFTEIQVYN